MGDRQQGEIDSPSATLAAMLVRVGARDRDAFEQLYSRTSAKLFGICLRILGNRSDAEGVLQEVYISVWEKADRFDPQRASPITWLATIARNKAIDRLRRRRDSRPIDDEVMQVEDGSPSPATLAEADQERRRLVDCLGELDGDQAVAIRQAFFNGFTYAQLAIRDRIPLGTLKSRVRRGLMRLKDCLQR